MGIFQAPGATSATSATAEREAYHLMLADLTAHTADLLGNVGAMTALLSQILDSLIRQEHRPNVDYAITLTTFPTTLSRAGRRHNLVFLSGNTTQAVQLDMGAGAATITLNAGWNVLDATEGARIWLASGGPVQLMYRASDDVPAGLV